VTMALKDIGLVDFEEPFTKFRAHGTIVKDGAKMSKSRGNVVVPDQLIEQWGADTIRMYLMFLGAYQEGGDFRDAGISGIRRFLDKVWGLVKDAPAHGRSGAPAEESLERLKHRTIQKVTSDTESLDYNTAISAMMEYVNALREGTPTRALVEPLVVMLAPYAPHFAEECWARLGCEGSVMDGEWPAFDASAALENQVEVVVQVNGKVRGRLTLPRGAAQDAAVSAALADAGVQKFVAGKEIRKTIYVADKLVSLVV
jgi:leucyl-tRNA synthetase